MTQRRPVTRLITIEGVVWQLVKPKKRARAKRDRNWKRVKKPKPSPVSPGMTFGHLTVMERTLTTRYHPNAIYWRCMCVCGTGLVVRQATLLSGHKKSCGLGHRFEPPNRRALAALAEATSKEEPNK